MILSLLGDSYTNSLPDSIIILMSALSIICGIFVIISKNPIVSVLFLIGLFLCIASYLVTLGLTFIGLSYLLVYVGAVSILFLFILMLINVRVSELVTDNNNSVPLSIAIIAIFSSAFHDKIPSVSSFKSFSLGKVLSEGQTNKSSSVPIINPDNNTNFASSNSWDTSLAEVSHITSLGNILYTSYPMLLLQTSVILLLAMIGAIVITIKK